MYFIPGWLIAIVTFPGVIVHEIGHRIFADLGQVPVYKICYFRIGNPSGYVVHGPPKGLKSAFLISVGPLIINTLLCALLTFPAVFPLYIFQEKKINWIFIFLAWIGISIGMHAFPSGQDVENLVNEVANAKKKGLFFFASKIFEEFFQLANWLRILRVDAIYAFGVALLLPWLFGYL